MTPLERELLKSKMFLFDWRYGVSMYKDAVAYKLLLRGKNMHTLISGRPENFLVMRCTPTQVTIYRRRFRAPVQCKSYKQFLRRWQVHAHQYFEKEVQGDVLVEASKDNTEEVLRVLDEFISNVDILTQEDGSVADSIKQIADCRNDIQSFFSIDWTQQPPQLDLRGF